MLVLEVPELDWEQTGSKLGAEVLLGDGVHEDVLCWFLSQLLFLIDAE